MCFGIVFNYVFLTLGRGWVYGRILTISDYHIHSTFKTWRTVLQFLNLWVCFRYQPILARRPPFCLEPTKTNAETNLTRCGGWHAIQCCVKKQFLFKTGKVQTYCCKQERGRHRTTKTNGKNQRTSNDIKPIKIFFHDLTCMFGYVWIYRCI